MAKTRSERTKIKFSTDEIEVDLPSSHAAAVGEQLATLVSPLVESLGLVGDYIRFFRERATIRALRRVREIARENQVQLNPVAPKFLIQWVEGVSLEDDDSFLTEMWASLLLAQSSKSIHSRPIFIDILKKMENEEAAIFQNIGLKTPVSRRNRIDEFTHHFRDPIRDTLDREIKNIGKELAKLIYGLDLEVFFDRLVMGLRDFGIEIFSLNFTSVRPVTIMARNNLQDIGRRGQHFDPLLFPTLVALQVLRKDTATYYLSEAKEIWADEPIGVKSIAELTIKYWCLTQLGTSLFQACNSGRKPQTGSAT